MKIFSGKIALVTGLTDRVSFAIARRLAEDGAQVVICNLNKSDLDKELQLLKSKGLNSIGLISDIGKSDQRHFLLENIKKDYGGLDILICNSSANDLGKDQILSATESDFNKIFDINFKTTFMLIKEAVPLMEGRKNPSIVTVASLAGLVRIGSKFSNLHSISKTAVISLTKALVYELASKKIRINCIAPGLITEKTPTVSTGIKDVFTDLIPLKRPGLPEECSGTVSYLCSDDASYITGETIVISGGIPSRL